MAVNIQLKDFAVKASPVPADIIYGANSADSFNEVQMTIANLIAAYPALASIGQLTTAANEMIYTTGVDTYATTPVTAFGLSILDLSAGVTTPTAGDFATWDVNKNLSANSFIHGFTTTTTAAGTTTLTVANTEVQEFTGSTTQTIVMPVTSTLVAGQPYTIINNSSGALTVNSSGGNLIQTMAANTQLDLICVLASGTTAASWQSSYITDTFPLGIGLGGTGVTSVTTAPTASAWAGWDSHSNLSANSMIEGFATTVTAAGTTTLTVSSKQIQEFTGSSTQTVVLPVTSTLVAGQSFDIINNSSGNVTVQSSGANTILTMAANTSATIVCVLNSGTTAASWNASYFFDNGAGVLSITGTANQVIASASTGAVTLSLPQDIATTSNVTFASVAYSDYTKGTHGTGTNDSASAGYVGEVVSASVTSGSGVSLSNGTAANITSISLTAGDWDVEGNAVAAPSTTQAAAYMWISTTSATFPDASLATLFNIAANTAVGTPVPVKRISVAVTTTVYLSIQVSFGSGTCTGYGNIIARRRR